MTDKASSITYDGGNLPHISTVLTAWFGPSTDGAWSLVKVGMGRARIELRSGDIYFTTGQTLWIKGTSVLVEVQ